MPSTPENSPKNLKDDDSVDAVAADRVRYTLERLNTKNQQVRAVQAWEVATTADVNEVITAKVAAVAAVAEKVAFRPIGKGNPLLIEVREIYTGNHPGVSAFGSPKKKNLLLSTAVRGWAEDDAQPRAVNCITEDRIGAKSHIAIPGVLNKGTSVVYYSPAMLLDSITVRFEIVFDEFDPATINAVSNGLKSAAGLPVFLPYGAYLLAASSLLKLVSQTGDRLFDGKPVFAREKVFNFGRAGTATSQEGYYLLAPEDKTLPGIKELWEDYEPDANGELRHRTDGSQWNGDYPYILYSLDGTNHDDVLGSWAATAMSAEEIERFFNVKNREAAAVDLVVDGLKSGNDLKYWNAARKKKAAAAAETNAGKKEDLEKEYEALKANILDSDLKNTA